MEAFYVCLPFVKCYNHTGLNLSFSYVVFTRERWLGQDFSHSCLQVSPECKDLNEILWPSVSLGSMYHSPRYWCGWYPLIHSLNLVHLFALITEFYSHFKIRGTTNFIEAFCPSTLCLLHSKRAMWLTSVCTWLITLACHHVTDPHPEYSLYRFYHRVNMQ